MPIYADVNDPGDVALVVKASPPRRGDLSSYIPEFYPVRRISGRHMVVDYVVTDDDGRLVVTDDEFTVKRKRITIPKGHPWRGRRAGRAARAAKA